MKLKLNALLFFAAFFVMALVLSCASNTAIQEGLTAPELIQRAQEASDRNRYNVALDYYQAVLGRYPLYSDYVCAAEYEIAFIYYKQKKYDQSKAGFNALLARYDTRDGELLPPQYRILANKILETIAAK